MVDRILPRGLASYQDTILFIYNGSGVGKRLMDIFIIRDGFRAGEDLMDIFIIRNGFRDGKR
jgi:hypothetical protein